MCYNNVEIKFIEFKFNFTKYWSLSYKYNLPKYGAKIFICKEKELNILTDNLNNISTLTHLMLYLHI